MSLQEKADKNYKTKEGRYLYSFVIIGESGDLHLPADVHARLYNCSISKLTLDGNNVIFLEGGTCGDIETKALCRITARGTSFTGTATYLGSTFDLHSCKSVKPWKLVEKSHGRTDSTEFTGSAIAIELTDGSQFKATRSSFSGHSTSAIKAQKGSYAVLHNCAKVIAVESTLWALDRSIIETVSCSLIQATGNQALRAEDYGRVDVRGSTDVKGNVHAGLAETHGFLSVHKCANLLGVGGSAFRLDTEAELDLRSFTTARGQGASAIRLLAGNRAIIRDGQQILSDAKDGVEVLSGGLVEVTQVGKIQGTGRNGIRCTGSRVYVDRSNLVQGQASDGIYLEDGSFVHAANVDKVLGVGGCGVKGKASVYIGSLVASTVGQASHGIELTDSSQATLDGGDDVTGQAGDGISMRDSQSVLSSLTNVTGQGGSGISGRNSRLAASKVETIQGQGAHGVSVTQGGSVSLSDVESVQGSAGHGVEIRGANGQLRRVGAVNGSSGAGLKVTGDGADKNRVIVEQCGAIRGSDAGLDAFSAHVRTRGSVYGGDAALRAQDCIVDSIKDTFQGDSDLTRTVLSARLSTLDGDANVNGGSLDLQTSTTSGKVSLLNGASLIGITSRPEELEVESGSGVILSGGGTSSATLSSGGGMLGAGADLGNVSLSSSGVGAFGGSASISGTGGAVSAAAGEPETGVDYLYLGSGTAKMQDQLGSYFEATDITCTVSSIVGSSITVAANIDETAIATISRTATAITDTAATITLAGYVTLG